MQKVIITDDLESAIRQWIGESLNKPLDRSGKWGTPCGKNNKYRIKFALNSPWAWVYDWTNGTCQSFKLRSYTGATPKYTPPPPKDTTEEFKALEKAKYHPYLERKKVALPEGINIRQQGKNLIVPIYSKDNIIISWQEIFPEKDSTGRDKKFKFNHTISGQTPHFIIGNPTDRIYICEGLATGLSVHKITGMQVYLAFTCHNLETVATMVKSRYNKSKKVIICRDNDLKNTIKIKNKTDFIVLTPGAINNKKTDFNDVQDSSIEKAKLLCLDPVEAKLFNLQNAEDVIPQTPVSFHENALLDHDFNFIYGATKIGKTRGLLLMLKEAMEKQSGRCAILSTDNDEKTMLTPLLREMTCLPKFLILNTKLIKHFSKAGASGAEKIEIFFNRLHLLLSIEKNIRCLLIDPLPRFLDWNNETLASLMIDNLRDIAKMYKVSIHGVRNEGKNQNYETNALYKGSSAIGDNSRQVLRALKCHRRSAFAKEVNKGKGKEKCFVIYTELSSLYGEVGYLFKLEIVTAKKSGQKIAVPKLVKKLEENIDDIKYLCSKESGQTLANKIFAYIAKTPQKGCTLEDLYNEFGHIHQPKHIRDIVYRSFDNKKVSGITYVQLNNKDKK